MGTIYNVNDEQDDSLEEEHLKYRLPLQGNTDTNADPISPGRCLKPHSNSPAMETTNQASDKHTNPNSIYQLT